MSFSTAKASISGSSVVPGLPNTISTPSCLRRSRKARFPDMRGTGWLQGNGGVRDRDERDNADRFPHHIAGGARLSGRQRLGSTAGRRSHFLVIYNRKTTSPPPSGVAACSTGAQVVALANASDSSRHHASVRLEIWRVEGVSRRAHELATRINAIARIGAPSKRIAKALPLSPLISGGPARGHEPLSTGRVCSGLLWFP